jgi:hypothetical protein
MRRDVGMLQGMRIQKMKHGVAFYGKDDIKSDILAMGEIEGAKA